MKAPNVNIKDVLKKLSFLKNNLALLVPIVITLVALLLLIPMFVFTFGSILGSSYEEVIAYYQRPFPAVVAALTMLVGFFHFRGGVQTLIEDYVHGFARKVAIIGMICLSYGAAAFAIFAIVRIAL